MSTLQSLRGGLRLFRAISPQIRASQIDMLLTISMQPGISQSELAIECDVTLSAVSRAVDVMGTTGRRDGRGQALALITAERAAGDDRTIVLRLTSKGNQLIDLYQQVTSGSPL
jgi:DNA-binding MarR family transcriptional regulator